MRQQLLKQTVLEEVATEKAMRDLVQMEVRSAILGSGRQWSGHKVPLRVTMQISMLLLILAAMITAFASWRVLLLLNAPADMNIFCALDLFVPAQLGTVLGVAAAAIGVTIVWTVADSRFRVSQGLLLQLLAVAAGVS